LYERDGAFPDMVSSKAYDVGASLSRVQQKRERKARLCPYRVMRLELADFFRGPSVQTGGVATTHGGVL